MIGVFICEDQDEQRNRLTKVIDDYVVMENLDMEVVLSTTNPYELLEYVKENNVSCGLYFLDIHLKNKINGIEVATEIKKYDKRSMTVFVTIDPELMKLTFKYHVEAIAYIIKDDVEKMEKEIKACIDFAQDRLVENEEKMFIFKIDDKVLSESYSEILYFEKSLTNKNKVKMITKKGSLEFYKTLKEIESMHESFHRVGGSYVFNMDNVKGFMKKECEVIMINDLACGIPQRRAKDFVEFMEDKKR